MHVKILLDDLRDGLYLTTQLLFDLVEQETVFPSDEVDRNTKVTKSARSTNAMEIGFCMSREIKVDDDVDCLNINTAGQQVGTHQVTTGAVSKVVEYTIAVVLEHLRVRIVA